MAASKGHDTTGVAAGVARFLRGVLCGGVLELNRRKLASQGIKVRVTAEKAKHPARLDEFRIEVEAPWPCQRKIKTAWWRRRIAV